MQKAGAYLLSPPLADPVTKIRNRFLWQPKLPRSSFITAAKTPSNRRFAAVGTLCEFFAQSFRRSRRP
jgi:hypothetical protein